MGYGKQGLILSSREGRITCTILALGKRKHEMTISSKQIKLKQINAKKADTVAIYIRHTFSYTYIFPSA